MRLIKCVVCTASPNANLNRSYDLPDVNFFAALIEELRREHEVLLTSRPLANTIDLLKQKGFAYHVVGSHYRAVWHGKRSGSVGRVI
jgi:predicted glycosyltransferase